MMSETRIIRMEEQLNAVKDDVGDIKTSLSDIARALQTLAAVETSQSNMKEALCRAFKEIEGCRGEISQLRSDFSELRIEESQNAGFRKWVERGFWVVFSAAIAYFSNQ